MNFVNTQYLPHIIIAGTLLLLIFAYSSHKYFKWVKTYWFFERSWMSRFSGGLYIFSLALMLLSLMDLRGPEQKVTSNLPDQRTIIILDTSSSMLAEDVRPSRFGKAIQVARHFVKNSPGHQISLVLFSDVHKRLIPFTDDIDLLDSRLAALEKTNSVGGGSNISLAISESAQYFNTDGDKNSAAGNILVLTDAEESEGSFDVEISNNINLVVVGIGTAKGGNIPLRWEDGGFKGYKNYQGDPVTTKLDEEYIKSIGKDVKNYRYWVVNSYTLPTEEIKDFFKGTYNKSQNKGDMRVRPVFSHLILIPAIILYCLSVLFGRFASFRRVLSIGVIFLVLNANSYSQEEEPKKIPPEIKLELEKMKTGNIDRKEVLKIAEKLLRNNDEKRASELYNEYVKDGDDEEVFFNQVTSLLKENKMNQALPLASRFLKSSKNEELKDKMRSNLLIGLKKQEEQKKQDKKDKKDKEKKDDKEKKEEKENKENKDDKGQKKEDKQGPDGKGEEQKKKDGKSEGQDKEKDDKKDSEKEKEKEEPKDLVKPERKEGTKSLEEKEKEIEQKRKMVKTPAMIKQILSDDRELQKKMMDTSTRERGDRKPKRDW